jgi:hypothetical protein
MTIHTTNREVSLETISSFSILVAAQLTQQPASVFSAKHASKCIWLPEPTALAGADLVLVFSAPKALWPAGWAKNKTDSQVLIGGSIFNAWYGYDPASRSNPEGFVWRSDKGSTLAVVPIPSRNKYKVFCCPNKTASTGQSATCSFMDCMQRAAGGTRLNWHEVRTPDDWHVHDRLYASMVNVDNHPDAWRILNGAFLEGFYQGWETAFLHRPHGTRSFF